MASGTSPRTVAPTVIITGRSRMMPASSSASSQRLALLVRLLDEVEEHDDVAHDDADEADDAEERHEAEGLAHDAEGRERADDAVGNGREDEERLHRVPELEHQREVDRGARRSPSPP